ncbi:MAG: SPFH domain-containing protein [Spirochaetales bacterium]|nr:SPFH domain-containing protein [Spirochaetales bacterium]
MGLLDKLKGELIDVVEWIEQDDTVIAYRFERYGNEIKNGAQLTVREGQVAAFINEGQLADVFEPGRYTLDTLNLPVLSTLKGWKHGFQSPFKAEVYFISTRSVTGFGWGTPSPFTIRDPEFGVLEIIARGHFSFHVMDPARFIKNVVGTDGEFTKQEIQDRLRKKFVTEAITAIAGLGESFYQMSGRYDQLSEALKKRVELTFFETYGISLDDTSIQHIGLSESSRAKVESRDEALFADSRIGNYERVARADAMKLAAQNPGAGGFAAGGMGMGMGLAMAQQMGNAMNTAPGMGPGMGAVPPPPPVIQYYAYINGQQTGPLAVGQLAGLVSSGQLNLQTQMWKQGMSSWAPAGTFGELGFLFQNAAPEGPPPVPGSGE